MRASPNIVVASRLLAPLLRHAGAHGVDVAALCERHELRGPVVAAILDDAPPAARGGEAIDVSIARQARVFDDVAHALGDDVLGARLGLAIPRGTWGLLEFASHIGRDLRAVAQTTIETTPIVSPVVHIALHEDGDTARFVHVVDVDGGYGRHAAEMTIAGIYTGGRRAVSDAFVWREAWVMHDPPSSSSQEALAALWGCPVRYGQADNGFAFDRAMLDLPTRFHDDALHGFLRAQAEREIGARGQTATDALIHDVSVVVVAGLDEGVVLDAAAVARRLALSQRTLQRRLAERGTSLSRVLDEVREARARARLVDHRTRIDEIALGLGFADVAAFGRAFRRWTGTTPTAWRDALR